MRQTDGGKFHCPMCQSRCRAVGCMFWVETSHNHGECAIRYYVMGLPMPKKELDQVNSKPAPEPIDPSSTGNAGTPDLGNTGAAGTNAPIFGT